MRKALNFPRFRKLTSIIPSKYLLQAAHHSDNTLENLQKEIDIVKEDIADNKKSLKIAKQDNNTEMVLICSNLASSFNNVYAELLVKEKNLMGKEKEKLAGIYRYI